MRKVLIDSIIAALLGAALFFLLFAEWVALDAPTPHGDIGTAATATAQP